MPITSWKPSHNKIMSVRGDHRTEFAEVTYVYGDYSYVAILPIVTDSLGKYVDFSKTKHNNLGRVYL